MTVAGGAKERAASGARTLMLRTAVAAGVVLLPGLVLAPVWPLGGLGPLEDDVLYYLPSRVFFAECVRSGQPLWLNPWSGLDRPFLADPQSAVFYPFTWLFAWLPPLKAYAASLWLHYALALGGAYRLLRGMGYRRSAAAFGGIAFGFGGFMLAHRAHFAMQHAAAWTPWVLAAMQRYAQRGGGRDLGLAAVTAALCCLAGHVQVAALTALGSLAFVLGTCGWRRLAAGRWLLGWAGAGGLVAVQLFPSLAYVWVSTRDDRGFAGFVEIGWDPRSAIGLALPMFYGQRVANLFAVDYWGPSHQCEQFAYAGIVTLLLAGLTLHGGWRRTEDRRAWSVLAALAVLTALGKYGPVCLPLYLLPGADLFRVPARATLLLNLAMAGLAAAAINDLASRVNPARVRLRSAAQRLTARPLLLAATLFAGLYAIGGLLYVSAGEPAHGAASRPDAWTALGPTQPAWWIPALVLVSALTLLGIVARRWRQPGSAWLLAALLVVDLGVIGWTLDVPPVARSASDLLGDLPRDGWVARVRESGQRLWVVSPRDDPRERPGQYINPLAKVVANTNMLVGVQSATDYGPLQPDAYDRLFPHKPWGETAEIDPRPRLLDPRWRRVLNIGWVLLCRDDLPPPPAAELVHTTVAGYRLYRNHDAAGPAFMEDAAHPGIVTYRARGHAAFATRVVPWPPALPERSDGPGGGRVVVARLALPGWSAWVDGRPVPIEAACGGLLAVRVAGSRPVDIEWRYFPPGLILGAAVSVLAALGLLAVSLRGRVATARGVSTTPAAPAGPVHPPRASAP
ncbi:MAG: YfhO family protein [Phycisphaerae bacterium]|nr:hypothetical protein [Phycisphaerae bacterium]MCZ2398670.1 YfhO family protein [Phycisphaerae bacterium]